MKRTAWLDLETTGLNPNEHGIIQIAIIIEDNGKIVDKFESKLNPGDVKFDKYALDVNNTTKKEIQTYPSIFKVSPRIDAFLTKHTTSGIKLAVAGYNIKFDIKFLSKILIFKDFFHYYDVDVYALLKIHRQLGKYDGGMKLVEACKEFKIKHKAHDAMSDIKATRKLYKKLLKC